MPAINSLGVGSGLELGNLVDSLVNIQRQTAEGPLNRKQARTELSLSAIGSLNQSVSALLGSISALEELSIGRTVESSSPETVTGTALASADQGSYLVNVAQIATAQSLATANGNPFADADASLGEGTLTVAVNGSTLNIELTEGSDSLRDVRDAINSSSLDIQAALVQEGDNYHLLLSSGTTGTDGEMTLTVSGSVDTRLASENMDETMAAQNAQYTVNGLSLESSSNTVADVLPGVTMELHAETGGEYVALEVGSDTQGLGAKLEAVVTGYNQLVANIQALGGASPDGQSAGPLVGDASLRALERQIGSIFSKSFSTDVELNPFSNLVALGFHKDLAGTASFDSSELQAALDENEAGVEGLISSFVDSFKEQLEGFTGSDGILTHRTEQLTNELRRIGTQREDLDRRMESIETRLVARFSALDALVAQFNNTSSFLSSQLDSLRASSGVARK